MKTFKNKNTGVLEHVTNELLIEQYEKYTDVYEVINENNEPTVSELKKKAKNLGITFNKNVTKEELLNLIHSTEN